MTRRTILTMGMAVSLAGAADTIAGTWDMTMETPGGERKASPTFTQDGAKVGGKWDASDVKGTFEGGKLELDFPLASGEAGYSAAFKVSAKLEEGVLKGTWSWATYGGSLTGKKKA
ncbi:MAG: hypothetical protein FJW36_24350 [Acidobacteria bacterium]|nr:hypothetical protein [Acidobacteriota bacterium]